MHRIRALIVGCMTSLALAACAAEPEIPPRVAITEEGCVTGGITSTEFILTDLVPGMRHPELQHQLQTDEVEPRPTTEAYRLIGNTEELQALVGRRARVRGDAEVEGEVEIRELNRPQQAGGTLVTGDDNAPTVDVVEQVSLEIHELEVVSIEPTGEDCTLALD
jgi:hypothetical protein